MRGYKHDFHHHLQALKGQLEAGEVERAIAYIEELDLSLIHIYFKYSISFSSSSHIATCSTDITPFRIETS